MTTCALQTDATSVYAWVQVGWAAPYEVHINEDGTWSGESDRAEPPPPTLIVVACKPADTLADIWHKAVEARGGAPLPNAFPKGPADASIFQVRGCAISLTTRIDAVNLQPWEWLQPVTDAQDCRAPGEAPEASLARLAKVRAFKDDYAARKAEGLAVHAMVDRVRQELTMSDEDFQAVRRAFSALHEREASWHEYMQAILDSSRDCLSEAQARKLQEEFEPDHWEGLTSKRFDQMHAFVEMAQGGPSLSNWLHAFALGGYRRVPAHAEAPVVKPAAELLNAGIVRATFHGLEWDRRHTYLEARPIIAAYLLGGVGLVSRGQAVDDEHRFSNGGSYSSRSGATEALISQLDARAKLRVEALRLWGRAITLVPFLAAIKAIYLEVSLRPGNQGALAAQEHFEATAVQ